MMQADIQSIQRIAQDLNNVRGQLQTTKSQIGEISTTLELLEEQPEDNAVFRAVGPLLLEVGDRSKLKSSLNSSLEALIGHSSKLEDLEQQLLKEYERISAQIES
ncbi:MAG: hypothetical protein CBD52_003315 [Euryarchaeota archaeon TMED192]|nr:MAG: hypothetical protein CBD52_003315 [Euryarchaeota archaeon TMED192]